MKQLLILVAACLTLAASAQTKEVEALQKKLAKSDVAVADAKKSAMASTWIERANIKIDMGMVYTNKLIAGLPAEQLITPAMVGAPKSTEKLTVGENEMTKYVYDNFDMYANADGVVTFWDVRIEAMPDAFGAALKDLSKAKELSAKDFAPKGKAIQTVDRLYNELRTCASNAYSLSNRIKAGQFFELSADVQQLTDIIDTTSYYYAGIAYFEGDQYDRAMKLFDKVYAMGYESDGTLYHYISACQEKLGDKTTALATAEKGFAKFPSNAALMGGLINMYMISNQNPDKLIDLVHRAQALDSLNASLYLVESEICNKLGQHQQAYQAIEKAIALEPNNFGAIYNYGILKVLEAEGVIQQANKLELNDTKNYDALVSRAVELQKEAILKLEAAYELQKDNVSVVELLRQLYFPRRDDSEAMQARYDFFNDLSKKLKGE